VFLSVSRGVNRSYIENLFLAGIAKSLVDEGQCPRITNRIPSMVADFMCFVSAIRQSVFGPG
jgi:hypothetical protein